MKLFFFDTETTGLESDDQILQFGAIYGSFDGKEFHEEHRINQYINVTKHISREAKKVHGINRRMIKHFGYIEEYIDEILGYIEESDYVIGHNVDFDIKMLKQECKRIGKEFDRGNTKSLCTMQMTTNMLKIPDPKWGYKWPKLQELHNHLFGESFEEAHNAMADIEATKKCFIELVKLGETPSYITNWDYSPKIPLIEASRNGYTKKVKELLDTGADIEDKDSNGQTALMQACLGGHIETIELLLKHGANTEDKDSNGNTALIRACFWGHTEVMELLLKHGANTEDKNNNGETALMYVIKHCYNKEESIELLLKYGAKQSGYTKNQEESIKESVDALFGYWKQYAASRGLDVTYNMSGFDKDGIHKDTGTKYDKNGFDKNNNDKDGYNRVGFKDGYNRNGYDGWGFDKNGINKDTGAEYSKDGFDKDGCDKDGYNRAGFKDGHDYDKYGYDRGGFDKDGYNNLGFNREGIHKTTGTEYDEKGYDVNGDRNSANDDLSF